MEQQESLDPEGTHEVQPEKRKRGWAFYLMLLVLGGSGLVSVAIMVAGLTDSIAIALAGVALMIIVIGGIVAAVEKEML